MPFQVDFDPTHKIVRCRFAGDVTDEVLRELVRTGGKYVAQAQFRVAVADFSAATSFEVSRETVLELASPPSPLPDPSCVRVVIAPAPVIFGVSRMFAVESERTRPQFHVVATEQEAWALLGVHEPRFGPDPE